MGSSPQLGEPIRPRTSSSGPIDLAARLKPVLLDVVAKAAERERVEEQKRQASESEPLKGGHWTEAEWAKFESVILNGSFRGIEAGRPLFAVAIFPARKPKPFDLVAIEDRVVRSMPPLGSNSWNHDRYGRS